MTQRAGRPVRQRLTKPISLAMFQRRETVLPEPPAPALLILESSVSAGCDTMAATTPATTPEPSEMVTFVPFDGGHAIPPVVREGVTRFLRAVVEEGS